VIELSEEKETNSNKNKDNLPKKAGEIAEKLNDFAKEFENLKNLEKK
jgi:hypothetical protein